MHSRCPACGAEVPAGRGGPLPGNATCPACPGVSPLESPARAAFLREAFRRSRFRVSERPGELEISWRWFKPRLHLPMAVFCSAMDTFLAYWYHSYWTGLLTIDSWSLRLVSAVFPFIPTSAAAVMTYATLVGFWNRTTLRATREGLSLRSGPLPAVRKIFLRPGELRRVYGWVVPGGRPGAPAGIQLLAADPAGGDICLIQSLESEEQARDLARKITEILRGTL